MITPPVALASYAAASISESAIWETGWLAFKMAIPGFLVPYVIIYNPGLILEGTLWDTIWGAFTTLVGILGLVGTVLGFFFGQLSSWKRFVLLVGAVFLIVPEIVTDLLGMGIVGGMWVMQVRQRVVPQGGRPGKKKGGGKVLSLSDIELNLLRKTELWIEGVRLENASLDEIAQAVARVLELEKGEVLVVDVREEHVVLDILRSVVRASQIMGKAPEILRALTSVPGVFVSDRTTIHSEGALGWVVLDPEESKRAIEKSVQMSSEIREKVARRAIVFSTGTEVETGMIVDTNFPLIEARLKERGYHVRYGGILPDEMATIAYRLERALDEGYGLIITTGGEGAEDKDRTVEALLRVDPGARTPYILKFEVGTGRHVKDGVRIGMGKVGLSRLVALPGPTEEVAIAIDRLLEALDKGWDENQTAEHIASALRGRWRGHEHPPKVLESGDGEP